MNLLNLYSFTHWNSNSSRNSVVFICISCTHTYFNFIFFIMIWFKILNNNLLILINHFNSFSSCILSFFIIILIIRISLNPFFKLLNSFLNVTSKSLSLSNHNIFSLLKELMFHWDNIEARCELLNWHGNDIAHKSHCNCVILEMHSILIFIMWLRVAHSNHGWIETERMEKAQKPPEKETKLKEEINDCSNHKHLSLCKDHAMMIIFSLILFHAELPSCLTKTFVVMFLKRKHRVILNCINCVNSP